LVYSGSPKDVPTYFESLNYPCPSHTNPADHVLDLVSDPMISQHLSKHYKELDRFENEKRLKKDDNDDSYDGRKSVEFNEP